MHPHAIKQFWGTPLLNHLPGSMFCIRRACLGSASFPQFTALRSTTYNTQQQSDPYGPTDGTQSLSAEMQGPLTTSYSPGHGGRSDALAAPSTAITGHCDVFGECLSKADELEVQMKVQAAAGDASVEVITAEAMAEYISELRDAAQHEVAAMTAQLQNTPLLQQAGMHEIRRTLYYSTGLKEKGWLGDAPYTGLMRMLTVELLRRDQEGVMSSDDVLYVSTHMIVANFYNRQLWNRMERSMMKFSNFENIDLSSIKAFTTRMFKTRPGCPVETLDMRRKILVAMSRRVGTLANDFDLPSLLGVLQCYSVHDLTPIFLEPLAIRATNHVADYTPHECATLCHVTRKWRLMRLEVCERLVERICTSDQLTAHMANAAMISIRTCFNKVSDNGRNALNAEPMRQKLRALGEQVGCRLEEISCPSIAVALSIMDIVVTMKIYIPKSSLLVLFEQSEKHLAASMEHADSLLDPKTGTSLQLVTAEEARQLQALLHHYGRELAPTLLASLKDALQNGLLPDEAAI